MKYIPIIATVLITCANVLFAQSQSTSNVPAANQTKIRQYLDKALKETNAITDEGELALSLQTIAWTQTKIGDVPAALKLVERIEKDIKKESLKRLVLVSAYRGIAYAQARAGDLAAALLTAKKCGKIGGDKNEDGDSFALQLISQAQAERGDLPSALSIAETLDDATSKDYALQGIAQAQVKAGDATGARRTAEKITDDKLKAESLVIKAVSKEKPIDETEVTNRSTAYERCRGYLDIAMSLIP